MESENPHDSTIGKGRNQNQELFPLPCVMRLGSNILKSLTVSNPIKILQSSRFRGDTLFLHLKCTFPIPKRAIKTFQLEIIKCKGLFKGFIILASRIRIFRRRIDVKIESPNSDLVISVDFDPSEFSQLDERIGIRISFRVFGRSFSLNYRTAKPDIFLRAFRKRIDLFPDYIRGPDYMSLFNEILKLKSFREKCHQVTKEKKSHDDFHLQRLQKLLRSRNNLVMSGERLILISGAFEKFNFLFPFGETGDLEIRTPITSEEEETIPQNESSSNFSFEKAVSVLRYLYEITQSQIHIDQIFTGGLFAKLLEYRNRLLLHHRFLGSPEKTEIQDPKLVYVEYLIILTFSKTIYERDIPLEHVNMVYRIIEKSLKRVLDHINSNVNFERRIIHLGQQPKKNDRSKSNKSEFEKKYQEEFMKFDDNNLSSFLTLIQHSLRLREKFCGSCLGSQFITEFRKSLIFLLHNQTKQKKEKNNNLNNNIFRSISDNHVIQLIRVLKYLISVLVHLIVTNDGVVWKSRVQLFREILFLTKSQETQAINKIIQILDSNNNNNNNNFENNNNKEGQQQQQPKLSSFFKKKKAEKLSISEFLKSRQSDSDGSDEKFVVSETRKCEFVFTHLLYYPSKEVIKKVLSLLSFGLQFNSFFCFLNLDYNLERNRNSGMMRKKYGVLGYDFFSEEILRRLFHIMKTNRNDEKIVSHISCILISLQESFIGGKHLRPDSEIINNNNNNNEEEEEEEEDSLNKNKNKNKNFQKNKKRKKSKEEEEAEEELESLQFKIMCTSYQLISKYGNETFHCALFSHFLYIFQHRKPVEELVDRMKIVFEVMNEIGIIKNYLNQIENIINSFIQKLTSFSLRKNNNNNNNIEEEEDDVLSLFGKDLKFEDLNNLILCCSVLLYPSWWLFQDAKFSKVTIQVDEIVRKIPQDCICFWRKYIKNGARRLKNIPIWKIFFEELNEMNYDEKNLGEINLLLLKEIGKESAELQKFKFLD